MITMLVLCMSLFCVHASVYTAAPKKESALARLYKAQTPEEHEAHCKAVRNALLPLPIAPSKTIPQESRVDAMIWHPNGLQLTLVVAGKAVLMDLVTGGATQLIPASKTQGVLNINVVKIHDVKAYSEPVYSAALNCDGSQLATQALRNLTLDVDYNKGSGPERQPLLYPGQYITHFWDTKTGQELEHCVIKDMSKWQDEREKERVKPFWHPHTSTLFFTQSHDFISGYDVQRIEREPFWDRSQFPRPFKCGHIWHNQNTGYNWQRKSICSTAWNAQGNGLITASKDKLCVWNMETYSDSQNTKLGTYDHVSYSTDGNHIATAAGNNVRIWDEATFGHWGYGKFSIYYDEPISNIACSPAKLIVSTITSDPQSDDRVHFSMTPNPLVNDLMIVGEQNVIVLNMATGRLRYTLTHQSKVTQAIFNHDGTRIATITENNAYIWDAATGDALYVLPQAKITAAQWGFDNAMLAMGSDDKGVCFWDTRQHEAFVAGKLTAEQMAVVCAQPCKQFRARFPAYIPYSLKRFARDFHTPGVTTAQVARVLLTLPRNAMQKFLSHHTITTKKQTLNCDDTKPEDYLESFQAFEKVQEMIPLGDRDDIKNALEQYIVDAHPTLDSTDAHEDLIDLARILAHERFKADSTTGLIEAVKMRNIDGLYKHLNPASVVGKDAEGRTALMHAIYVAIPGDQREDLTFKTLFEYQELYPARDQICESDLAATDCKLNTPLMLAIDRGCFHFALKIAQKMDRTPSLHHAFAIKGKEQGASAYDLAVRVKERYKDDPDYQALMKILEKQISKI